MSTKTYGVVIALTCMMCAPAVSAQSPQDGQPTVVIRGERARQPRQPQQQSPQPFRRGPAQRRGGEATAETTETVSRTTRLVQGATLELRNMTGGNVTINGGDGRDLQIVAVKRVRNAGPRTQAVLDSLRIAIAERGGNVEVQTLQPRMAAGRAVQINRPTAVVDYTVILPSNANVVLRTGAGSVRMQNVTGDVFNLTTLGGDVILQELRGRMLDLRTVTGNMMLQNIAAEQALLESTTGNLEFAGPLQPTGRYVLRTHRGNIRFMPIGPTGFDLDATTYRGDVRSDFVFTVLPAPRGLQQPKRALKGKVGDAGAALTAFTFGGNIVIIKP